MLQGLPLFAATEGFLDRFWQSEPERAVLWIALIAVLGAVACYLITKIRPKTVQKEPKASQWLSKFRESHSRGELTDEEFRTIKTTLATQLQDELKDNGETD
jgi:hypothetical protein